MHLSLQKIETARIQREEAIVHRFQVDQSRHQQAELLRSRSLEYRREKLRQHLQRVQHISAARSTLLQNLHDQDQLLVYGFHLVSSDPLPGDSLLARDETGLAVGWPSVHSQKAASTRLLALNISATQQSMLAQTDSTSQTNKKNARLWGEATKEERS